jgi:AcrR family transcriptional regulator
MESTRGGKDVRVAKPQDHAIPFASSTQASRLGGLRQFRDSMAKMKSDTSTIANRNQRRRQRTRETILAGAELVFRRKGIDGTVVTDITEQADVAYGSFYNHFKSIDEVVAALVGASLQRVADRTGSILEKAERVALWQDPAIRWLLGRPYVFVDEFYKVATPFMVNAERAAVEAGVLRPAGGHDYWLRVFPWLLIAELTALAETGNITEHEERFARASLRLLGVDDTLAPSLIARSRELVAESGIPEPKLRGAKRARGAASSK